MADKAKAELKKQEEVSVQRIAEISDKIREAVRAALPAPPEQHFTIMVPGKVINFNVSAFLWLHHPSNFPLIGLHRGIR